MDDDVFDDDDGVVDDEADGGGETTERHQVEGLSDEPEEEDGDGDGDGNDEAGDERAGPVAQEEEEDDAGEDEADEDGVADAGDGLANELGLIVEGGEMHAGRELGLERGDLVGDGVGDLRRCSTVGWRVMLMRTDGRAVGRDRGVDGHGGGYDLRRRRRRGLATPAGVVLTTRAPSWAASWACAPTRPRMS